jgi:glyoxylate reductase
MSDRPRVFVTQPVMPIALELLEPVADVEVFDRERMISRDELKAGLRRCDWLYMLGDTPIDAEILDANPELRGIAVMTMNPNVVDLEAATERGIPVTNIAHVIATTTCDLTMALILGLATRLVEADAFTRAGRFHQEQSMTFLWHALPGKVVGLIGMGKIGREIAKRCRAFELDVLYTKNTRLEAGEEQALGVRWVDDKDDILRGADFVVIMASYNPTTHLMIGERELGLMKPSAFFVNTGRGRIVDEPALLAALRERRIAGAGLDVYWTEPPVGEPAPPPELFKLDNVILTPHIGSATHESRHAMARMAAENLVAMIEGRTPPNLLNPDALRQRDGRALTANAPAG